MVVLPEAGNSRANEDEDDKARKYFGGSVNKTCDELDVEV